MLALLKPLFDLNRFDPTTRTRLRTALLHLLLPHLDTDRRYDLKERRLGAALARELELDVDALGCWDVGDAWGGQYARREIPVCLGEAVGREWERRHGSVSSNPVSSEPCPHCAPLSIRLHVSAQSRKCNSLTLLQVDTLLDELAAHSKWSSSRIKCSSSISPSVQCNPPLTSPVALSAQHSKPRPVTFILRQLFPQSISSFQASYITQTILRDVSPLLAPPPTAQRTVSLKEYDSKSRYLLDLTDALRLTGGPTAMRIWQRCADLRQAMLDLEDFEEHGTTPRVRVGINVQVQRISSFRVHVGAYTANCQLSDLRSQNVRRLPTFSARSKRMPVMASTRSGPRPSTTASGASPSDLRMTTHPLTSFPIVCDTQDADSPRLVAPTWIADHHLFEVSSR